jgi:hypothetical protein
MESQPQYIWLSIQGNVGWYYPDLKGDQMVGFHSIAFGGCDDLLPMISPKQRRKIERIYVAAGVTTTVS